MYFSHNCNVLTNKNIDEKVKLVGWVQTKRDHGDLVFIDLYDFHGVTQLVCEQTNVKVMEIVKKLSRESVISIKGTVVGRGNDAMNKKIVTGAIEVVIDTIEILNESAQIPFELHNAADVNEEMRLKYRFLELRGGLNKVLQLRSRVIFEMRQFLHENDFIDVETPILTGPSPEGARDFVVPSRLNPGRFYALPQAPQIFKQLLMVGGIPKYYQFAKCFRDEDLRKDRALEFTQLDMEFAFVNKDQIFECIENLMFKVFNLKPVEFSKGFKRITYDDAMNTYGSDKPDLRNPLVLSDLTDLMLQSGLNIFVDNIKKHNAIVKSIPAPSSATQTRKFFNEVMDFAVQKGAKGLAYIQKLDGQYLGPIAKRLSSELCDKIFERNNLEDGDSVFFVCDNYDLSCSVAGHVRNYLGKKLNLYKEGFEFCWIVDFPFFALDEKTQKLDFNHNPFSMPYVDLIKLQDKYCEDNISQQQKKDMQQELLKIKAHQYDLVCNGYELASGAIRNHALPALYAAFKVVGYDQEFMNDKFHALITGLKYGAPPHGGIALGVDRIMMLLAGKEAIREVVAFTANQSGVDHLMKAPNKLSNDFLTDLSLKIDLKKTETK